MCKENTGWANRIRYMAPLIRGLVSMIPTVGGPLEVGIEEAFEKLAKRRHKVFFDELSEGLRDLTPELIESEDFLHCSVATYRAAMRARRTEKIRFLANMMVGAVRSNEGRETEEYEELLAIVDELSFRELDLLMSLSRAPNPGPYGEREMTDNLAVYGIARGEATSILYRLLRSGLIAISYAPASQGFYDKNVEGQWYFTPRLTRLKQLVAVSQGESESESRGESERKAD